MGHYFSVAFSAWIPTYTDLNYSYGTTARNHDKQLSHPTLAQIAARSRDLPPAVELQLVLYKINSHTLIVKRVTF